MAFFSQIEEYSFLEHIQSLEDEELLAFWEETQIFTKFLEDISQSDMPILDYEDAIVQELQYRFSNRYFSA